MLLTWDNGMSVVVRQCRARTRRTVSTIDPASGWMWVSTPLQDPGSVIAVTQVLYTDPVDRI